MPNDLDEPFGRQPRPVKFTIEGETIDIDKWYRRIRTWAESRGDNVEQHHRNIFTIYPRAVND